MYYTASEGVTNAVKHSGATQVTLHTRFDEGQLVLLVNDNGVGGAAPGLGTGLTGLQDRVTAHGGTLRDHQSSADKARRLTAVFPCAS